MTKQTIKFFATIVFISLLFPKISIAQENFWGPANMLNGDSIVYTLTVNSDGYIFAGTDSYHGGVDIYYSTDTGSSWIATNMTDHSVMTMAATLSGRIFAGTDGDGVYRSTNNGILWERVRPDGMPNVRINSIGVNNMTGQIFAGTYDAGIGKIYRSIDNGDNWSLLNSTNYGVISSIAIDSIGNVFMSTFGGIYQSTNNGVDWNLVGLSGSNVHCLLVDGSNNIYAGGDSGIYRSTNNGQNWLHLGLQKYNVTFLTRNLSNHLFAGTWGDGIFQSKDNGISWDSINTGLTNRNVTSLAVTQNGFIIAGTDRGGVFRSNKSTTTGIQLDLKLPVAFSLQQNYPNPFNPSTVIEYSLPEVAHVILKAYNILGQEVITLVDESEDIGYKAISFNASNLPGGIYLYRLQAGKFFEIKKMLLVK